MRTLLFWITFPFLFPLMTLMHWIGSNLTQHDVSLVDSIRITWDTIHGKDEDVR